MPLRNYIIYNFWWKLLSLLLAAMTWLIIQAAFQRDQNLRQTPVMTSSSRIFPTITVAIMASPTNWTRFRVDTPTVAIEVSGTAEQLSKLQAQDIQAYVDLSDVGNETQLHKTILAQAPPDFKIETIKPATANLERYPVARP